ncbi:MAG TPA: hypothetical protein VMJ10_19025 [Kofleriaceae bacterium]|nr:hypothetical protein [Kofleriaceae bacterium]
MGSHGADAKKSDDTEVDDAQQPVALPASKPALPKNADPKKPVIGGPVLPKPRRSGSAAPRDEDERVMYTHGPTQQPAPQHEPASEATAPVFTQLLQDVRPIDLGEQVKGSHNTHSVLPPFNMSESIVHVGMVLEGSPELKLASAMMMAIPEVQRGAPIEIEFAPTERGEFHATLAYLAKWENGHSEQYRVPVTARARLIVDVPQGAKLPAKPSTGAAEPAAMPPAKDRFLTVDENRDWDNVDNAYDQMATAQDDAIIDVSKEAAKYKPRPAPESLWKALAEIAIMMGASGIAAVVTKLVAAKVVEAVQHAGHLEMSKAHEESAVEGIAKAVEEGIKTSAEKVRGEHDGQQESQDKAESEDKEIAFFGRQRDMVRSATGEARASLVRLIADILKRHPETAAQVIEGMRAAFLASRSVAFTQQAQATAAAWAKYRAQQELGHDEVATPQGPVTATRMDSQRTYRRGQYYEYWASHPKLAAGVIEIEAELDRTTREVSVTGARMHGISYSVAHRLLPLDLAAMGLPFRISLFDGAATITRDEAGRVRTQGLPLDEAEVDPNNTGLDPEKRFEPGLPSPELQQIREAERIVNMVLSKPLSAWGVAEVETDDANQNESKGNQKKSEGE